MKKLILCTIIFFSIAIFKNADAQVSVNINIGSQPVWGPVGYDYAEYYYMPDMDMYYYVPRRQFVYLSNGNWVFSASLPARYRNYDLNNTYKVVINEPRAYLHYNDDRVTYSRYRGNHNQVIIRNSNEPKYFVVKGHPHYNGNNGKAYGHYKEHGGHGHGNNGHGNGHGNGNGHGHD